MTTTPRRGDRFEHRRLLEEDLVTHVTCEVTAFRKGTVYFRPVGGGGSHYAPLAYFLEHSLGRWL